MKFCTVESILSAEYVAVAPTDMRLPSGKAMVAFQFVTLTAISPKPDHDATCPKSKSKSLSTPTRVFINSWRLRATVNLSAGWTYAKNVGVDTVRRSFSEVNEKPGTDCSLPSVMS